MKHLFPLFVCLTIAATEAAQTVVIERKEFNPWDSTCSLVTEGLELVHTSMDGLLDSTLLKKWDRGEMREIAMVKIMQTPGVLERFTTASLFVKLSRLVSAKKREKELDLLTCYIIFTSAKQIIVNGNATLQVIFEDGTSRQYQNEAQDKVWKKGKGPVLKSAQLSAGEIQIQGQTNQRNRLTIPKMVAVVNSEPLTF